MIIHNNQFMTNSQEESIFNIIINTVKRNISEKMKNDNLKSIVSALKVALNVKATGIIIIST